MIHFQFDKKNICYYIVFHHNIKFEIPSNWYKTVTNKPHIHQNICFVDHNPSKLICHCFKQWSKFQKFGPNPSVLEQQQSNCQYHESIVNSTSKQRNTWCCLKSSILRDTQSRNDGRAGRWADLVFAKTLLFLVHLCNIRWRTRLKTTLNTIKTTQRIHHLI